MPTRQPARIRSRSATACIAGLIALWGLLAGDAWAFPVEPPMVPPGAAGEGAYDGNDATVDARLLVDGEAVVAGRPVRMGVLFTLDPGWHLYWRNSGESGVPTQMEWNSVGAQMGPVEWPAPQVFSESDGLITTYGYEGEVLLAREVVFDESVVGTVALTVDVGFIVCEIGCIPGEISLYRAIDVLAPGSPVAPGDPEVSALFDAEAGRIPVQPETLGVEFDVLYSQTAIRPGEAFKAAIVVIPCSDGDSDCRALTPRPQPPGAVHGSQWTFVPDLIESVDLKVVGQRRHPFYDGASLVNFTGEAWPGDDPGDDQRLKGVIALLDADQQVHTVEVDLPLPRARAGAAVSAIDNPFLDPSAEGLKALAAAPQTPAAPQISLAAALLLAFLGGVVLNAMPCVLPVLFIKIFGVAALARRSRRELLEHGAAYTAGIVLSMLVLAAVVAGLRSAGTAVGWGFQFQEPLFVACVSTVLVVFAMNLFGVFEIGFDPGRLGEVGAQTEGPRRSFFEGLLAVVLATPCSAPFLGAAVGFAFASPPAVIFAIFAAIGLGLASPYALVTLVPGFGRLVPKPGAWMVSFRKLLGVVLLATVVWLVWVAGRVGSEDGLVALVVFLVAVAGVTWVAGHFQSLGQAQTARRVAAGATLLGIAALVALPIERPADAQDSSQVRGAGRAQTNPVADDRWQSFERGAVEAALADGKPVFVTFTADWCITCKLNERVVLSDEQVQDEFDRLGVATFKADWTRRDETIRRELARFGRAGVPLYLVYTPDEPGDPTLLPELLTVDRVLSALRDAAGGARTAEACSGAEAGSSSAC